MANIYKRWLCDENLKTLSTPPISIYFEFKRKPSLITVIWMDPHTPKKFIATKYCFLILGDDTSFFFFLYFSFLCYVIYFVIINFYRNCFLPIVLFIIIIIIIIIIIYVPGCSGMFRNVPCSGFYRRPTKNVIPCVRQQAIYPVDSLTRNFITCLGQRGKKPYWHIPL